MIKECKPSKCERDPSKCDMVTTMGQPLAPICELRDLLKTTNKLLELHGLHHYGALWSDKGELKYRLELAIQATGGKELEALWDKVKGEL